MLYKVRYGVDVFEDNEEEDSENWEYKTFREAIAGRTQPFILAGTLGLGYE